MSATTSPSFDNPALDPAIIRARDSENVAVGHQIVRHRLSSRLIHWGTALAFAVTILSGLPIWTPIFAWWAPLFGGLATCRVIHPFSGSVFFLLSVAMFLRWVGEMRLLPNEKEWLGRKMFTYMMHETSDDSEIGKYNGGQKLFFFAVSLGALGLMLSGLVLWQPLLFPAGVRQLAILVHETTFLLFAIAIVFHVYLGTGAEPGTFRAMTRGTVPFSWARLHHPRWYREVTGDESRRP